MNRYYIKRHIPKILKYLIIVASILVIFSILSVVGSLPSVQTYFDKVLNPTPSPLPFYNPYNPNSTYYGGAP